MKYGLCLMPILPMISEEVIGSGPIASKSLDIRGSLRCRTSVREPTFIARQNSMNPVQSCLS